MGDSSRHRPRPQQPRQRDQVARRICARILALRRMPGDVPQGRRWRRCRLDTELPGRRCAGKSGLGRRALILRTESGGIPRTARWLGNCQRPLRFSRSKLRSGEQCRGASSVRGKHPDVPGIGSQTRYREGARMSCRKCCGAIERRSNRCTWQELPPRFASDWARRSRSTEQPRLEKALEFARRTLGNAAGLAAWMEGWAMPVEQAIHEALNASVRARSSEPETPLSLPVAN